MKKHKLNPITTELEYDQTNVEFLLDTLISELRELVTDENLRKVLESDVSKSSEAQTK